MFYQSLQNRHKEILRRLSGEVANRLPALWSFSSLQFSIPESCPPRIVCKNSIHFNFLHWECLSAFSMFFLDVLIFDLIYVKSTPSIFIHDLQNCKQTQSTVHLPSTHSFLNKKWITTFHITQIFRQKTTYSIHPPPSSKWTISVCMGHVELWSSFWQLCIKLQLMWLFQSRWRLEILTNTTRWRWTNYMVGKVQFQHSPMFMLDPRIKRNKKHILGKSAKWKAWDFPDTIGHACNLHLVTPFEKE